MTSTSDSDYSVRLHKVVMTILNDQWRTLETITFRYGIDTLTPPDLATFTVLTLNAMPTAEPEAAFQGARMLIGRWRDHYDNCVHRLMALQIPKVEG